MSQADTPAAQSKKQADILTINTVSSNALFDGIVTTSVGNGYDDGRSVAVQADGKILLGGSSSTGADSYFALVRYNNDGSLDTSFDADGKVTTNIGIYEVGLSVAVQADGKVLLGGASNLYEDFTLVRYNMDGSLDNSFDGDGIVTTNVGYGYSVAVQADGKILLGGRGADNIGNGDFALVRYNSDGTLDTNFNNDGIVTTDVSSDSYDECNAITVQADGKILLAGSSYKDINSNGSFTLVRYNSDGSLDTSFDSDGIVTTDVGNDNLVYGNSVTVQPDGKILWGGISDRSFTLVRYNNDGSLDTSFSGNGVVTTSPGSGYSVTVQPDGKILLGGNIYSYNNSNFGLVRYNNDGSLDTSFGNNGIVTTAMGSNDGFGQSVVVQADGKILLGGNVENDSNSYFALVRYNSDGSLDSTFNANDAPTLTAFTSAVTSGNEDSNTIVTFAELQAQADATDVDGTVTGFVVKAVSSGKLKIGLSSSTARDWNALSNNTIDATHQAYWTPARNVNGTLDAFTVVAKDDGGLESDTPVQATVNVISVPDVNVAAGIEPTEGGAAGTFTVTLDSPAPAGGLTVNYTLAGTATLATDYTVSAGRNISTVTSNSFTIAEGQASAVLNVIGLMDAISDPKETVSLKLTRGDDYQLTHGSVTTFTPKDNYYVAGKNDYVTGLGPTSVGVGDFNNDGKLDLAVANYHKNTVSVLLRNATNTGFDAKVDSATELGPYSVSVGDFNNDGKLDLAVANYNHYTVSVLLRNATNTNFDTKVNYVTGLGSESVGVGDFNNDSKLDLVVANNANNTVSVLLRNATNTDFDTKVDYVTGLGPASVNVADFNNDGKLDLAVANRSNNTVSVLLRNANNTDFDTKVDYVTGLSPTSVGVGDFNNDGKLDLAVANIDSSNVSVLLRNATNTGFDAKVDYAVDSKPFSVGVGDFNNDGKLDLAVANGSNNTVSVLLRNATNTGFDAKVNYVTGLGPTSVGVGDFNNDGKLDLAVASYNSSTVRIFINDSSPIGILTIANNQSPTVVASTPTAFTEQTPVIVNRGIKITDYNGDTDWNGGTLRVQITSNNTADDNLMLPSANNGSIWLNTVDNALMANTTVIGSANASAVSNDTAWILTFNAAATNALVQSTAQAIQFINNSDTPSTLARTVTFTATDKNTGTTSATQTINVNAVNDAPTLTAFTSNVASGNEDNTINISYSMLQDQSDTNDVDGAVTAFVVKAVNSGTLNIGTSAWNATTNNIVDAAHIAYWTPATNANGILNAFTAVAKDNSGLVSATAIQATVAITAINDAPTGTVIINGIVKQNEILTASNTLVDAEGLGAITYSWLTNDLIVGTDSSYKLTVNDVGKKITVIANYIDGDGIAGSVTSAATDAVLNVNDLPVGNVTIAGTATQGEILTASNDVTDADGLGAITYQWKAGNTNIGIGNSYTLTQAEVGKTITVTASYTDGQHTIEHVTSIATTAVLNVNDLPTGSVKISGITKQNEILTVSNTIVDADGLKVISYQWKADGINIGNGNSYKLTHAEIDKTITVTASYIDNGNTAESVSSTATANVARNFTNFTIYGDEGGSKVDVITGASGNDSLYGKDKNDVLSGDEGNDIIYGGYGKDSLYGGDGNDKLYGEQDNDYMDGGAGNDTLDGGLGVDTMIGGAGNDTYYLGYDAKDILIDNGLATDIDTVIMPYQLTKYTLPAGIENATITDGSKGNLTGNDSDNALTGNDGKNILSGAVGRDSLFGGAGNDVLVGGDGNDTLSGGSGKDTFKFDTTSTDNADKITDFAPVDDTIQLDNTIFTQLSKTGVLNASMFVKGSAAIDSNDYVIYNATTGAVTYDADGSGAGAGIQIATVGVNLALTAADFVVI